MGWPGPKQTPGPAFLVFLTIHVPVGLTAVISGALAAIARKQLGRHTQLALRSHPPGHTVHITAMSGSHTVLLSCGQVM